MRSANIVDRKETRITVAVDAEMVAISDRRESILTEDGETITGEIGTLGYRPHKQTCGKGKRC